MASTQILSAINAKRQGERLSPDTISSVVADYTSGAIPDYQMAAWLMAVTCRGMDFDETTELTRAYVASGETLGFDEADRVVLDKHSTGGVGDKTTLVVVPLLASLGIPVAKMSGRGLDFAGGTLDKLESIPGIRLSLAAEEIRQVVAEADMAIVEQTANLVPADGLTYALRDVTGTVQSLPLIAASIMSKKIAAGTNGVVLDVKFGSGALTGELADALELARLMVRIGSAFGLRCHAVISDMNEPLGWAAGNALEVREAIAALGGSQVSGLTELCCAIAAEAVLLAGRESDRERARALCLDELNSGRALVAFRRWVVAQGGDPAVVDDPELLVKSSRSDTVTASDEGWVQRVDARAIGLLCLGLGAGRTEKGAAIDRSVGVVMRINAGDRVASGQPLADVHWHGGDIDVYNAVRAAVMIADCPVTTASRIHAILTPEDIEDR